MFKEWVFKEWVFKESRDRTEPEEVEGTPEREEKNTLVEEEVVTSDI